jgi:UDP-N-acetylglucosamine 2-epimerase
MKKLKILTILGTRPEIIRLSKLIQLLDKQVDHKLLHTGQNYDYELNQIFFKDLGIKKPKYQLSINKNKSVVENISTILVNVEKIFIKEKPDAVIVLGDTNSCLSAYAAKRLKIPIFHIEAGNRCYDQRVPEEINRRIIDHISDINVAYSERAKENLLRENISPDTIFKIGSPLYEVYKSYSKEINQSKILKKLSLEKEKYFLISVHREENLDNKKNFDKFLNFLFYLEKRNKEKIIVSTHPRTIKKLKKFNLKKIKNIIFAKPFSYTDYCCLQINSKIVFSDSGSITEEANIMNFRAINLRSTNERQEGMNFGAVPMVHFNLNKIENLIKYFEIKKIEATKIDDYISPNFSKIFYNILISYIDYVNENTWKK